MNFTRHEPGRYGAISADGQRRYVVRRSGKEWRAQSFVMARGGPKLNMDYGPFATKTEAVSQCETWARERREPTP